MRLKLLFLAGLCVPAAAFGQKDLKNRLIKQPLYLRGRWVADDLHFDSDGILLSSSETTSFTLSGVEITKLQDKDDRLLLIGHRVGLELDGSEPKRVLLTTGRPHAVKEELRIEILKPASGDYTLALQKVITDHLEDLANDAPAYWRYYFAKAINHTELPPPLMGERSLHAGGDVKEAFVAKAVEPTFNEYAKSLMYQGKVQIHFILGANGKPHDFSVIKPLGLGLDELAIEAITQYTFGPAARGGKAVPVALTIEANFQIF